jgi:hypothetical protein
MSKKIHVHVHDAEEEHWVTIRGAHVRVNGEGKVVQGPGALKGRHAEKLMVKQDMAAQSSENAYKASKFATTAELHRSAVEAHEQASQHHGTLAGLFAGPYPDKEMRAYHSDISKKHKRSAEEHKVKAARLS